MIVTIDGPAGAGKSSTARTLAKRLGFEYLDTGAMYRAVALAGMRNGISWDDPPPEQVETILARMQLKLDADKIFLNDEDISGQIRTVEVTTNSGKVAAIPAVRHQLVQWQQEIAVGKDMVCEGRDQGTVVFPNAECKFFLIASPEARAQRRLRQLQEKGVDTDLAAVLQSQKERDERDAGRDVGPMVPAPDATVLDNSTLTQEHVLTTMEQQVRRCIPSSPTTGTGSPTS